ncbi:centlein-like [Dendronephthya gigantea]|uniref:centlein-like n=1 Tax=Dendronephthya gigantea TaxID=151771 RepID=UPI00106D5AD0|nr:centlein-like [Dendronephthya gigantea]
MEERNTAGLDVNALVRENQVLSENLSKCLEEKNFVWSLWKKLQTEKPDLSSVVSLVMAREKEKTEVRDEKVLKILETKDLQIQQLERVSQLILDKIVLFDDLKVKEDDLQGYSLRLHDLLIDKAELQENMESMKTKYEENIRSLVEENGYLSEVVRARQMELENDKNTYKTKIDDVDKKDKNLMMLSKIWNADWIN